MAQVLSTSSATVTSTSKFAFHAYGSWRFDDLRMVSDSLTSTTTCSYDNANELLTMATGGTNTTFTYDDWGRTITKAMSGHRGAYYWRFGDKLKSYTTDFPDETTVYYNYDGLGKRRNRCENPQSGPVTWWRWDLGYNVIDEYTDSDVDWDIEGLTKTYIPGMAEIVGSNPATGAYRYYSGDHLGSVRRMRDGNKTSIATYEYDPYGGQYAFSGLALNQGFTGHTWEPDAGLYYAPYRSYSPAAAHWLTRDPLGMTDGPNVYAYVARDPVDYYDPLGLRKYDREIKCREVARTPEGVAYLCIYIGHHSDWDSYKRCAEDCKAPFLEECAGFVLGAANLPWGLAYFATYALCLSHCRDAYINQTTYHRARKICIRHWWGWKCYVHEL